MKLGIAGCGMMGKILAEYAREEGTFSEIIMIEPAEENAWPEERLDLIIDFSQIFDGIFLCHRNLIRFKLQIATS